MPALRILLNVEGEFKDLKGERTIHLSDPSMAIGRLPKGMESGKSSVVIRLDLPNGTTILAETSMALFLNCARAFQAAEDLANEKN